MLLAKAALPLPPDQLVPCLAFLTDDPVQDIRDAARKSLEEMPSGTVASVLFAASTAPPVLDRLSRVFLKRDEYVERLVLNRSVADSTLLFVAGKGQGRVLEIVSQNQARIARCPAIVKALYFNPRTRTATMDRVLEFAVRENLPIQDMPGYREIVAGVVGEARARELLAQRPQPAPGPATDGQPHAEPQRQAEAQGQAGALRQAGAQRPQQAQPAAEAAAARTAGAPTSATPQPPPAAAGMGVAFGAELLGSMDMEVIDDDVEAFGDSRDKGPALKEEIEDEDFEALLLAMMEGAEGQEEQQEDSRALYDKIRKMGVPARIRLALMGNSNARDVLIRDANKLVAVAVLRNPGLNDKDIARIAATRTVVEDVIRTIAGNKEWCKNYSVKLGLVMNPKTPQNVAISFIKFLTGKDLKTISQSKDVTPLIAKTAKRTGQAKAQGGSGSGGH